MQKDAIENTKVARFATVFILLESIVPWSLSNLTWVGLLLLVLAWLGVAVPSSGLWLMGYSFILFLGVVSSVRFALDMAAIPPSLDAPRNPDVPLSRHEKKELAALAERISAQ